MLMLPLLGEGCWGRVVEGLVGPVVVVLESPVFEQKLGFEEAVEAFHLEQLASQVAVEGLDERILPGAPGSMMGANDKYPPQRAPHSEDGQHDRIECARQGLPA